MYFVFTRMPGENYRSGRLGSLLLRLCLLMINIVELNVLGCPVDIY